MQREFRKSWLVSATLLALAVLLFRSALDRLPDRFELGPRTTSLSYQPVVLQPGSGRAFRLVGAWGLSADDSRFGGLSALALTGSGFVALTDSGVIARFSRPSREVGRISLMELPAGAGLPDFKINRDSEALAADPLGRGWWVAFETRDEVWLYDDSFSRALGRVAVINAGLSRNRGMEGMVAEGNDLLLFPESGGRAVRLGGGEPMDLEGTSGWLSDAAILPDGSLAVINRRPTPIGLNNDLVVLERAGSNYRSRHSWRIPVGRLDNVEGIAAEALPGGATRLWMVTDNGLRQRRPTLLLAVDFRPGPFRR